MTRLVETAPWTRHKHGASAGGVDTVRATVTGGRLTEGWSELVRVRLQQTEVDDFTRSEKYEHVGIRLRADEPRHVKVTQHC